MRFCCYFFSVLFTFSAFSQKEVVFNHYVEGSTRDEGCLEDCGKYSVIEFEPKVVPFKEYNAKELYEKTKNWLNEFIKIGEDVILGDNENEYIRFEFFANDLIYNYTGVSGLNSTPAKFQVEIRFRDGRLRWEYITITGTPIGYIGSNPIISSPSFSFRTLNARGKPVDDNHTIALIRTKAALAIPIKKLIKYLQTEDGSADDW
jgi:hypothetical protein